MSQFTPPFVLPVTGKLAAVLALIASTALGPALIASREALADSPVAHRPDRHRDTAQNSAAAAPAAASSSARLAAVIARGGAVVRSKGVQSVSNPFIGTYCIRPTAASGVNPRNVVPVVTVDYDRSVYNEVTAQYSDTEADCPSGTIEVLTFDDRNLDAAYLDSNLVGFTIVVN